MTTRASDKRPIRWRRVVYWAALALSSLLFFVASISIWKGVYVLTPGFAVFTEDGSIVVFRDVTILQSRRTQSYQLRILDYTQSSWYPLTASVLMRVYGLKGTIVPLFWPSLLASIVISLFLFPWPHKNRRYFCPDCGETFGAAIPKKCPNCAREFSHTDCNRQIKYLIPRYPRAASAGGAIAVGAALLPISARLLNEILSRMIGYDFMRMGGTWEQVCIGAIVTVSFLVPYAVFRIILTIVRHRIIHSSVPLCTKCLYDLTANESGRCPECGTQIQRPDVDSGPI